MEKKIYKKLDNSRNSIERVSFLVERIIKPSGEVIIIVSGGSPQMPQTLFVGTPEEYCVFIHN